ncbi:uncharacterized protein LOC122811025 [Protopterus annectens]|uniref:uncharacterized protein LOC122811025 n=1 Tax=Protopterus annectens TaxID=7888 RepID=UPI001CFA2323|nr:uncharacterized protein LOC122811025 [Protopterus annectens]
MKPGLVFLVISAGIISVKLEPYIQSNYKSESSNEVYQQTLYEKLWESGLDIADQTLQTDFLKQMQAGTLKAERYINFTLQDIYYAVKVTKILNRLSKRNFSQDETDLQQFFSKTNQSYSHFADTLLIGYSLKNIHELRPWPVIDNYVRSYEKLLKRNPLYFAVGMLPCSKLWPYIANKLTIDTSSPYYHFKSENEHDGSKNNYESLLERHRLKISERQAKKIFQTHMKLEMQFFAEA